MSSHARSARAIGWARLLAGVLAGGGLLACRSAVDPSGTRACPAALGEFGSTGCVELTGQVVGLSGQPLAGIYVGPRYLQGREVFNTVYATTDAAGAFTFRVSRMSGRTPAPGPDTVSFWVHGADPRTAAVNVPARVQDSVLVQAMVSPAGTIPTATAVRLTLPSP